MGLNCMCVIEKYFKNGVRRLYIDAPLRKERKSTVLITSMTRGNFSWARLVERLDSGLKILKDIEIYEVR